MRTSDHESGARDAKAARVQGPGARTHARRFQVFAVNPNANEVEGDRSYHSLRDIPGGVDAVVIATAPDEPAFTVTGTARGRQLDGVP